MFLKSLLSRSTIVKVTRKRAKNRLKQTDMSLPGIGIKQGLEQQTIKLKQVEWGKVSSKYVKRYFTKKNKKWTLKIMCNEIKWASKCMHQLGMNLNSFLRPMPIYDRHSPLKKIL